MVLSLWKSTAVGLLLLPFLRVFRLLGPIHIQGAVGFSEVAVGFSEVAVWLT